MILAANATLYSANALGMPRFLEISAVLFYPHPSRMQMSLQKTSQKTECVDQHDLKVRTATQNLPARKPIVKTANCILLALSVKLVHVLFYYSL